MEGHAQDDAENLAFMIAAQDGDVERLSEHLQKGLHVDVRDLMFGETALMRACHYGHKDAVYYLLACGADVNLINDLDYFALCLAVIAKQVECIYFLLSQPATNKDLQTKSGKTSLMFAASLGYVEIVELLARHGCDLNLRDADGLTSLHMSMLTNRGAVGNWDAYKCVCTLVTHGADVNIATADSRTPLHCAVMVSNKMAVMRLLLSNCDINKPAHGLGAISLRWFGILSPIPTTALVMAVYYLNEKIVWMLLEAGSCVQHCSQVLPYASKNHVIYQMLLKALTVPRTLKELSRIVVRKALGCHLERNIHLLDLPDCMKAYIMLEDLKSHVPC